MLATAGQREDQDWKPNLPRARRLGDPPPLASRVELPALTNRGGGPNTLPAPHERRVDGYAKDRRGLYGFGGVDRAPALYSGAAPGAGTLQRKLQPLATATGSNVRMDCGAGCSRRLGCAIRGNDKDPAAAGSQSSSGGRI